MKADVKTLISNLTSERNRIDAAIAALKAIGGAVTEDSAQPKKRGIKKGTKFSAKTRARMAEGQRRRQAHIRAALETQPATNATAIGIQ